ncbi:hypothetical protein BDR04DRAFT_1093137 [Suillus decipiens]|nr:hypothetical protein BDR04DRAFT_1093137 [Suillus decipiens]
MTIFAYCRVLRARCSTNSAFSAGALAKTPRPSVRGVEGWTYGRLDLRKGIEHNVEEEVVESILVKLYN